MRRAFLLLWIVAALCSCMPHQLGAVPPTPSPAPSPKDLGAVAAPATVPSPFPTVTPELCYTVIADALNVRESPRYNSSVLGWLYKGELVAVKEKTSSDWWRVKVIGINQPGYVRSSWLRMEPCNVQTEYQPKGRFIYLR